MADKKTAAEIAALSRLCGITMEYRDNFKVRRRTSRATMEALLTAMGVPCGTPKEIRDSLEHCQKRLTDRLLLPVTMATPGAGRCLPLNVWWPRPEFPSQVEMAGEILDERGEKNHWLPNHSEFHLKEAQPTADGYRLTLCLPLPADLADGYYDVTFRVKGAGRQETGTTYLAVSPGQAWIPPFLGQGARLWGLNLPLYALRSRRNWGIGDFADLRAATTWAGELGASFVGVNPLHAPQAGANSDPSPYSPTSRLFLNFLYVNLENVPEMQDSPEAQALLAQPGFPGRPGPPPEFPPGGLPGSPPPETTTLGDPLRSLCRRPRPTGSPPHPPGLGVFPVCGPGRRGFEEFLPLSSPR